MINQCLMPIFYLKRCLFRMNSSEHKIKKMFKKATRLTCRFGAEEGTFVKTSSLIEANALHLQEITPLVSPLKNCRTVVRQFLYSGEGSSPIKNGTINVPFWCRRRDLNPHEIAFTRT